MALYNGFFDAVFNEETGAFDREYGSGDFTNYFGSFIGSGVCIYENPDSMAVRKEGETVVVRPGYLFIRGYWLKNDGDYPVSFTGEGAYAVLARLNMGRRMIEITAEAKADPEVYPDALVLAYLEDGAVTDTRFRTDICGVIDAVGSLTGKIEFALNYIDTEIEDKLAQAEADIRTQEAELDRKIAGVQALVDKITPPPVGTIKFSASQNVGDDWLRCDGSFINESQYPELVAALGKLTPSGDKFKLISDGEIGPQLSNGALYGGRLWAYSYSAKKLYGVDVEGEQPIKEISLTSSNAHFNDFITPSTLKPICLSVVPHKQGTGAKLFLAQVLDTNEIIPSSITDFDFLDYYLLFSSEFSGEESILTVSAAFDAINITGQYDNFSNDLSALPYVCSAMDNGVEVYYSFFLSERYSNIDKQYKLWWTDGAAANYEKEILAVYHDAYRTCQRFAPSSKSKNECVALQSSEEYVFSIGSIPNGIFDSPNTLYYPQVEFRETILPLNIIGNRGMIASFTESTFFICPNDGTIAKNVTHNIALPPMARVFVDAGAYLWGKDVYMIFVGTGILFSRTLRGGDWGYLDTTSVLGTITQFGYLDYSEDEGTLYILGQDTANQVKAAKLVLNTLYDYANDGAWLPVIASDGVPAYIKAIPAQAITDPVEMSVGIGPSDSNFNNYAYVTFNGDPLLPGTYKKTVSQSGKFKVGIKLKKDLPDGHATYKVHLEMNGIEVIDGFFGTANSSTDVLFKTADYLESGIVLKGKWHT